MKQLLRGHFYLAGAATIALLVNAAWLFLTQFTVVFFLMGGSSVVLYVPPTLASLLTLAFSHHLDHRARHTEHGYLQISLRTYAIYCVGWLSLSVFLQLVHFLRGSDGWRSFFALGSYLRPSDLFLFLGGAPLCFILGAVALFIRKFMLRS